MDRQSDLLLEAYGGGAADSVATHSLNDFIISSRAPKKTKARAVKEPYTITDSVVAVAPSSAPSVSDQGLEVEAEASSESESESSSESASDSESNSNSNSEPDAELVHSIKDAETGSVDESSAEFAMGENNVISARKSKKTTHAWWLGSREEAYESLDQDDGLLFPQFGLNSSFGVAYGGFYHSSGESDSGSDSDSESDCGCGEEI